jgi:serine/threonine-protein kinase
VAVKVGELVGGRFELEELVGEGGMSSVYRAYDSELERRVAVKILHEHYSSDPEYVERFRREARAIARLAHPNVVTVIDRGEWHGRQYIVFEHVAGENLKAIVAREGPLPIHEALELSIQVGRALAFAHELGIVHRDVKPHNVLVDAGGTAKVTDFGIARTVDVDDALTQTGTVLGTGLYISPEQARGERGDERSDQYSFGVVMYELLTGDVPYRGDTLMAVAMRHVRDPVPHVREKRPEVPARVDAVVARTMAKQPSDRYPSLEDVLEALERCRLPGPDDTWPVDDDEAQTRLVASAPASAPEQPAPRRKRRSRAPIALAALVALGVIAALVLLGNGVFGLGGDTAEAAVRATAVADFDPFGGDGEHPETVGRATDGDVVTFWSTEVYRSFDKDGVGIVLEVPRRVRLSRLVVESDTPGFTALVMAGPELAGRFTGVSDETEMGRHTEIDVDTHGEAFRYYVLWITSLDGSAHVNEVRAFRAA